MAAIAKPRGGVPEKHGVTDVKQSAPSTDDSLKVAEIKVEQQPPVAEPELDEKDLENLIEANQKIPYSRFKEVNEKKKELETIIQNLKQEYEQKLAREIENAEARIATRLSMQKVEDSTMDLEPWDKKIQALNQTIKGLEARLESVSHDSQKAQLDNEIKQMEARFPEADVVSVLSRKRYNPHKSIEELMEQSHRDFEERYARRMRGMIDAKKKKAPQHISPLRQSSISFEAEKKAETLKDGLKLFKKYAGLLNK